MAVKREPKALADQRFVSGLISFADPSGNRLEAFHGAFDQAGNLYGTTPSGGTTGCWVYQTCGVVFELTPQANGRWEREGAPHLSRQGWGDALRRPDL